MSGVSDASPSSPMTPPVGLIAALDRTSEGSHRLSLSGRLDFGESAALNAALATLKASQKALVWIEIDGLLSLGGIGIARLEGIIQTLQAYGHEVRLNVERPHLKRAIEELGVKAIKPPPRAGEGSLLHQLLRGSADAVEGFLAWALLLRESLQHAARQLFWAPRGHRTLFLRSLRDIGARAAGLVALIALLIGAVLAIQGGQLLELYGQQVLIADLVALSMVKEIGPLVTAILVAGRSGSALTAEIGTMVVTEEVDALKVMGLSPAGWLVAPRLLALSVAMPLLALLANLVGIFGGMLVAVRGFGVGTKSFLAEVQAIVQTEDVLSGLLKAFLFGVLIASLAAWNGFRTKGGAGAVGARTTRAVVQSIVWVIVVNAIFTLIEWRF